MRIPATYCAPERSRQREMLLVLSNALAKPCSYTAAKNAPSTLRKRRTPYCIC